MRAEAPLARPGTVLAPLLSLLVLAVALLEGPRLARVSGLADLLPQWPIEAVTVTGELRQVAREELEAAIAGSLQGDFFRVDVGAVRDVAVGLPWVEEVSVRKVWPGKLHVQVRERQAAARWESGGLVATDGTLFHPGGGRGLDRLPALAGPVDSQARLLERLRALEAVLEPLARRIERVELDPRTGLRVGLEGGLELVLGHDPEPLHGLAASLPALLGARLLQAARVDLRYANGFAVRWKHAPVPAPRAEERAP